MEYQVVQRDSIAALVRAVNEYAEVGWMPQGGVSTHAPVYVLAEGLHGLGALPDRVEWCQALVRKKRELRR